MVSAKPAAASVKRIVKCKRRIIVTLKGVFSLIVRRGTAPISLRRSFRLPLAAMRPLRDRAAMLPDRHLPAHQWYTADSPDDRTPGFCPPHTFRDRKSVV